jgi:hypothetical protein
MNVNFSPIQGLNYDNSVYNSHRYDKTQFVEQYEPTPYENKYIQSKFNPDQKTYPDIQKACSQKYDKSMVIDNGTVTRVLPEDTQGLKHQLFLIKFPGNRIVKVAHNIDIAPRIPDLRQGQKLAIKGEFIKSSNVIHWTHNNDMNKIDSDEFGGIIVLSKGKDYLRFIT